MNLFNCKTARTFRTGKARTAASLALCLGLAGAIPAKSAPRIELGSASGSPGTTVLVPLTIRGGTNAVAVQLDLRYGNTNLVGQAPALDASLATFTLASNQTRPGVQRLILYSRAGAALPDPAELSVPFAIAADAAPTVTPVTIGNAILADAGARAIAPVNLVLGSVTITAATGPRFQSIQLGGDGSLVLQFTGAAGRSYVLQTSPDLRAWTPASTNLAGGSGLVTLSDRITGRQLFYRAALAP